MKTIMYFILAVICFCIFSMWIAYNDITYKNISEIENDIFKENFINVLKEIEWDPDEVINLIDEDDCDMIICYNFFYRTTRYYVTAYPNSEIYSISSSKHPNGNYIYLNENEIK